MARALLGRVVQGVWIGGGRIEEGPRMTRSLRAACVKGRVVQGLILVQGLVLLPTALLDVSLRRWHGNALEQERVQ